MAGPKSSLREASQTSPVKEERPVLFQHYFKSGQRTYAAQVKQASNGRPFLVLTEGRRDPVTDELHKSRVLVFSDDLTAFFHMLQETAAFLRPLRGSKSPASAAAAPVADPFASPQTATLPTRAAAPAAVAPARANVPDRPNVERAAGRMQPPATRTPHVAARPQSRPSPARPPSAARQVPPPAPAPRKPSYGRSAAQPSRSGRR